jgi:hypothetical protein
MAAALFGAAEVALFAVAFGDRPLPALIAAALVVFGLAASLAARQKDPHAVDRHLFKVVTALTVILGAGWVLSAGL